MFTRAQLIQQLKAALHEAESPDYQAVAVSIGNEISSCFVDICFYFDDEGNEE